MEKKNQDSTFNIEILTPTGFQSFDGVKRYWHESFIRVYLTNGKSIDAANDHRFLMKGEWVYAKELIAGNLIGSGEEVSAIEEIFEGGWFYDPVNVANGETYLNDGNVVSHNTFLGSGDTLINPVTLLGMRGIPPKYQTKEGVKIYKEPEANHEYMILVDVGKGLRQDYSTFTAIDLSSAPWEQVAVYRNNQISPILFPNVIEKFAKLYRNALVIVENNNSGEVVCNGLYYDLEYENLYVESAVKSNGLGINMNRKSKRIGCSGIKDIIEENKLKVVDMETIQELTTFVVRGSSYEASPGNHDDLVMNLVLFGYFASTSHFLDLTDQNLKQLLFERNMKEIEDDVLPFGLIDDGQDYIDQLEREEKQKEWYTEYNFNF